MEKIRQAVYNVLSKTLGRAITEANDEQTLFSLGIANGQIQTIVAALEELGFSTSARFQKNPTVEDLIVNFEFCPRQRAA
jgi:hypothetical protein